MIKLIIAKKYLFYIFLMDYVNLLYTCYYCTPEKCLSLTSGVILVVFYYQGVKIICQGHNIVNGFEAS